ncbi:hypothetical protein QL285_069727 [Trifolium repens]|nr:hypothetical protein QL285_069727 [Trifolium repens]
MFICYSVCAILEVASYCVADDHKFVTCSSFSFVSSSISGVAFVWMSQSMPMLSTLKLPSNSRLITPSSSIVVSTVLDFTSVWTSDSRFNFSSASGCGKTSQNSGLLLNAALTNFKRRDSSVSPPLKNSNLH